MQYFIQDGGRSRPQSSTRLTAYPRNVYPRCHLTGGSSHEGLRYFVDPRYIDSRNEPMMCYLGSNGGLQVDDEIYTHHAPGHHWMERLVVRFQKPMPGLTFDVEMVGIMDPDPAPSPLVGCGIKCGIGGPGSVDGVPDPADVTPLLVGVDADFDPADVCLFKAVPFSFAGADTDYLHYNHLIRVRITALPAEGLLTPGDPCGTMNIPCFTVTLNYADACAEESYWGDCTTGKCG